MELRHLRYFIAVAEELHFSHAAERLHMAQPPLSQQIANLEQELGVPLLHRTKRSVQLTSAGSAFLIEAKKTVAQAEQAVEVARQAHQGMLGKLEIGFVSSAMAEAVPTLLKVFRNHYPQIEIKLHSLATTEQVQALHEDQIHVGLLHPPLLDSALELEIIRQEPLIVALPEEHLLASQESIVLSQLREDVFILYPRSWNPGTFDQILSLCRDAGFSMRIGQEAGGMQSIVMLVAAGLGVSIVPASTRLLRTSGIAYRPLQGTTPTMDLAMAWLPEQCTPVTQNFLSIARLS